MHVREHQHNCVLVALGNEHWCQLQNGRVRAERPQHFDLVVVTVLFDVLQCIPSTSLQPFGSDDDAINALPQHHGLGI